MTRTSKKALVREVNPHLICVLCNGYFIEATTIIECLHSFCRSCLIKYLENNKFCPVCDVQLHKNNPLLSVRCDKILQQLVYKLVPGLYAKEMARRRKYYSELGGPTSSDTDCFEYPIPDAYYSPTDGISLSLEFISPGPKDEEGASDSDLEPAEKQGMHHRRYLQCPAAVSMSHLKKFLRMKYDLNSAYTVEILYDGEVLTDEFTLMDVAYTFSWNKTSPMRLQFRLFQKQIVQKSRQKRKKRQKIASKVEEEIEPVEEEVTTRVEEKKVEDEEEMEARLEEEEENERLVEEEANHALHDEEMDERMEEDDADQRLDDDETMERLEEDEVNQRIEEEALMAEEAIIQEIDDDQEDDVQVVMEEPAQVEVAKKVERINGLKRHHHFDQFKHSESKKAKRTPSPKTESVRFKRDEKQFLEEMIIEEDTDEDRLRISASEGEKSPEPLPVEKVIEEKPRSEERRKERKKSKKGKHHHHHRHHDKKRGDSPPAAQIVHSPENDIMKLKVKLTAIKNCDNMVKGYSVVEGVDSRKEHKENGISSKHSERSVEKAEKNKSKVEEYKKNETLNCNNNNNNNIISNNNSNNNVDSVQANSNGPVTNNQTNVNSNNATIDEISRRAELCKEKLLQMRSIGRKVPPKPNGTVKPEPLKMPPSSITVSKITAAEKRQMEQQKLLMNRNQSNGLDPKRPSLEIMLVNAPKKLEVEANKQEVKKVIRPTPPSIPLSRLPKGMVKSSPPPLRAVRTVADEALDLSGKSSRKSPEALVASALKIPNLQKIPPPYGTPARPCKPNPTVRQIPNPSALLFRQNSMNGRALPPPAVPISSLRHIESMTKKIEKVAAGLPLKPPTGLYMNK